MLGLPVRAKVVKAIGTPFDKDHKCPLNYGKIYDTKEDEYCFIMGVDHPVKNFDGRIIGQLVPLDDGKQKIWVIAPKSSRYINLDILEKFDFDIDKYLPNYILKSYYESSCGAIVYKITDNSVRYLVIKNKRSEHWGFAKGHMERGETKYDTARREVLEETGIHVNIHLGFEGVSQYKIGNRIDKKVTLFVGNAKNDKVKIQQAEIQDYKWLKYTDAIKILKFDNDRRILKKAHTFLTDSKLIPFESHPELEEDTSKDDLPKRMRESQAVEIVRRMLDTDIENYVKDDEELRLIYEKIGEQHAGKTALKKQQRAAINKKVLLNAETKVPKSKSGNEMRGNISRSKADANKSTAAKSRTKATAANDQTQL